MVFKFFLFFLHKILYNVNVGQVIKVEMQFNFCCIKRLTPSDFPIYDLAHRDVFRKIVENPLVTTVSPSSSSTCGGMYAISTMR